MQRFVPATGNAIADTRAIQMALDASVAGDVVRLDGEYRIDKTLTVPKSVLLSGVQKTVVRWNGADGQFLIDSRGPLAELYCYNAGVRMTKVTYQPAAQGLWFYNTKGQNLEAIDCWGSTFADIGFRDCRGTFINASRANSTRWLDITVGSSNCIGEGQTGVRFYDSDLVWVSNLLLESTKYGSNPAVMLDQCRVISMNNLRFESNQLLRSCILSIGNADQARGFVQRVASALIATSGVDRTRYFWELLAASQAISVEGLYAADRYITDAVFTLDNGQHGSPELRSSHVYGNIPTVLKIENETA